MRIITARNPHSALPEAVALLDRVGVRRETRNGHALVAPVPVSTVYQCPMERVVFWPERDANPFFHLYESLWMLAGRSDIRPLVAFAKNMANYSDDGVEQWGAYGRRWRSWFGRDQIQVIARRLRENPEDRRCVLQMWDVERDLDRDGRDVPCNVTATVQRDDDGRLDLVVFCRSNDIIWGAYGANAVHFSMLQEYLARAIGCPVGTYTQVSVNWHAYVDTFEKVRALPQVAYDELHSVRREVRDPYVTGAVHAVAMPDDLDQMDAEIQLLLRFVDCDGRIEAWPALLSPWGEMVYRMFAAHLAWRQTHDPDRLHRALRWLRPTPTVDWHVAGRDWLLRRSHRALQTQEAAHGV